MYDVVVVGQGLTGLLSAITAKEQNQSVAIVSKGTGKIIQSTGVMDLVPGSKKAFSEWLELYGMKNHSKINIKEAVKQFKHLMEKLGYPYNGDLEKPISMVTASGHLKETVLYPKTISPIPLAGHVLIVGMREIVDFQPVFVQENLQKERPNLKISAINVSLGSSSERTMTQLDAARLMDQPTVRDHFLKQLKERMKEMKITNVDMVIFPSALGVSKWRENLDQFSVELNCPVTEAPGMPPNATAVRLNELLKKHAIKIGVRFYSDTEVNGYKSNKNKVSSIRVKNSNRLLEITGHHFVIATGGILGGGLEVTSNGMKETALNLNIDQDGTFIEKLENVYPVGAAKSLKVTNYGITGGVYSIVSSYDVMAQMKQSDMRGIQHA